MPRASRAYRPREIAQPLVKRRGLLPADGRGKVTTAAFDTSSVDTLAEGLLDEVEGLVDLLDTGKSDREAIHAA